MTSGPDQLKKLQGGHLSPLGKLPDSEIHEAAGTAIPEMDG
jgi:hypothetical protein